MSDNKLKYWEVSTTQVVKARNKGEALRAATLRTRVPGTEVLVSETTADRISAVDAHELTAQFS